MLEKQKRMTAEKVKNSRKALWLALVLILGLGTTAVVLASFRSPEQHCVTEAQTVDTQQIPLPTPLVPAPMRCFDTLAEAIEYGTSGAIRLPKSAPADEVSRALHEYYGMLDDPR